MAPVLLDAAFDTSLRDLRNNWLPVSTLVLVAVGVTTAAVAVVAHWLRPDMPWAVAIALGAIVAPPDAAAATAILRQVNLPYRIQKILEGESLLNDASALLIYRVAVGLVAAEHMKVHEFVPSIALALFGSLIAGFLFARVWAQITRRITEAPSAIITQFAGTFMVWIVAEHIGLSGILTIVAYAITIARTAPERTPARLRVASYAVWETVVFVLNVLAFILIGMQLNPIWSGLNDEVRLRYCSFAAAILAVVIFARIAWVMPYGAFLRALNARGLLPSHVSPAVPTLERGIIVSWCGMRGIVTLAAAFALPEGFPYRDLILLTAFAVVLGTLVVQGLTLRPVILALQIRGGRSGRARGRSSPLHRLSRRARGDRIRSIRRGRDPAARIPRRAAACRNRTRTRRREQRAAGRSAAPPRHRRGTRGAVEDASVSGRSATTPSTRWKKSSTAPN